MKKSIFSVVTLLLLISIVLFSCNHDPKPVKPTVTKYNLTLNQPAAGGSFTVTVGSGAAVSNNTQAAEGETITLTAIEAVDYEFSGFTVTPAQTLSGTGLSQTFTMPAEAVTITAAFIDKNAAKFAITLTQPAAGGTFTVAVGSGAPGSADTEAAEGAIITLTATAETNYTFSGFTVTPAQTLSGTGLSQTFTMPGEAVAITAAFTLDGTETYAITVTQPAAGGTFTVEVGSEAAVSVDTEAFPNEVITLTAIPESGYTFDGFTVTPAQTLGGTGLVQTFTMPDEDVEVAAEFSAVPPPTYPLLIDGFTGTINDYSATPASGIGNGWGVETGPNLWANIQPDQDGSSFGRAAGAPLNIDISDYVYFAASAIVLDLKIIPAPYEFSFSVTVNGTVYSSPFIAMRPDVDVVQAFPLSQLISSEGASLAEQSGTLTLSSWRISSPVTAGVTGTRVFKIELQEIDSFNVSKGTTSGGVGSNDINFPGFTSVPEGNAVPVNIVLAPSNRFVELTFTPSLNDVSVRVTGSLYYFIMPASDVTVGAVFEEIIEPDMWNIEDFTDVVLANPGWLGDITNNTYGYWGVDVPAYWDNGANRGGPNWLGGPGNGLDNVISYDTLSPLHLRALYLESYTGLHVGRHLPVAMNISNKDTVRIALRRGGTVNLELGLFNGGIPGNGYNDPLGGNQSQTPTGGQIDTAVTGTGYWVAIPANTTTTSIANSSWDFLEIPLASFTSQGFDASLLTGYGIRVVSYTAANDTLFNRPKFVLDGIFAYKQADIKNISVSGTATIPYTTAVGGQVIPITASPGEQIDIVTINGITPEIANVNRPYAIILPDGLTSPVTINVTTKQMTLVPFEDFETTGTFTDLNNAWTGATHNNATGWFTVTNNAVATAAGSFSTAEKRPGTAGAQSVLMTYGNTGGTARQFRVGYRPYNPTIDASTYTHISFWVRSSRAGTFSVVIRNSDNTDRSQTFTIDAANTWERKVVALTMTTAQRNNVNYLGFSLTGPAAVTTNATLYIDDVEWGYFP